jgi:UDP-N-acetyl-D-mannosaminuronate dehydrogenase
MEKRIGIGIAVIGIVLAIVIAVSQNDVNNEMIKRLDKIENNENNAKLTQSINRLIESQKLRYVDWELKLR